MHKDIVQHQTKLERLFGYADDLQKNVDVDSEVVSHFTQYLCVRTSGYVESSIKIILHEYVKAHTSESYITDFVDSRLERNLSSRRSVFLALIGEFSGEWKDAIRDEIKGQELGKSLDDIVRIRNDIAHGKDVRLSLVDLKGYFEIAKRVVAIIDNQCLPLN